MRLVYFTHSLISCWNNGNAHFQRGLLRALQTAGHSAIAAEPSDSWSRERLLDAQGTSAEQDFRAAYPDLVVQTYADKTHLGELIGEAEIVIVHEWNDPQVVLELGRLRSQRSFVLLFHDTHHRAVSDPDAIRRFDLSAYDGVLAFGEALAEVYRLWGWGRRVRVWHEAADTTHFVPLTLSGHRAGATWIGNWGDGERTSELEQYLLAPSSRAGVAVDVHGVRYPAHALALLASYGACYRGWVSNSSVPALFARYLFTVHVPRRFYTELLPGIPTIRVFEALACGIPLISAPWMDSERLFCAGTHYLAPTSVQEAESYMRMLMNDSDLRESLAAAGRAHVLAHHSCDERVRELLAIVSDLRACSLAA